MPRTARASVGEMCYHVINRGNARQAVFHKDEYYKAFINLVNDTCQRVAMRMLGYCIMPNHFHLVLWPYANGDLGKWMQWLLTAHVRRYHQHYKSSGHVWQGRFKAFPVEQDNHLLTVLRYVERNPLRARLVEHAEDWSGSSLSRSTLKMDQDWLCSQPVSGPVNWIDWINQPQTESELEQLRHSVNRGTPYGSAEWIQRIATQLGLEASLHPRGRPKTQAEK